MANALEAVNKANRFSNPESCPVEYRLRPETLCAGDRVRIVAIKEVGSARLLNGLKGEVLGPHAFAKGWYKIRLEPNEITPHQYWSVPGDRLVLCDHQEI